MAEPATVAAGLWAAEEIVSTGIQAGVAGYAVAKPTMPLKATFAQVASSSDDASQATLTRSHHSLTVVGKKAYLFGGQTSEGSLTTNNIHTIALSSESAPEYQVLPALAATDEDAIPAPRTRHAACALDNKVAILGGCGEKGDLVDERGTIWVYDTEKLTWGTLKPEVHVERLPLQRAEAKLFAHDGNLVLYGGKDENGEPLQDVWHFNCLTKTWNALPHASVSTSCAALSGDTLYLISSSDALGSQMHYLEIDLFAEKQPTWESFSFPSNPIAPGPRPRENAGLLPVTTGYGRNYLLYIFGDQTEAWTDNKSNQWSDMWTFQLPSSRPEMKATTDFSDAIKPAAIKDQIRTQVGADTGSFTWAEVEVKTPGDMAKSEGKLHPGPRSCFACDTFANGRGVVLWGGVDANSQPKGDGWIIRLD